MTSVVPQFVIRTVVILFIISLTLVNARPSHFGENNQVASDQETSNALVDSGLKPWQMELLAQRLAELNNQAGYDYAFDRGIRSSSDIKRQSRYRLCYFNPVSCFRK